MCEVLLYLVSTLVDLGLLVAKTNKEDQAAADKQTRVETADILTNHNMSMDIVIR